jgi:hypothetical protein
MERIVFVSNEHFDMQKKDVVQKKWFSKFFSLDGTTRMKAQVDNEGQFPAH